MRTPSAASGRSSVLSPADQVWADQDGLHIKAWVDVVRTVGQKFYRLIRSGAPEWSVGFTIARSRRGSDGERELVEVGELLEVSLVSIDANTRTSTLGAKADEPALTLAELDEECARLGRPTSRFGRIGNEARDAMLTLLGAAPEHENGGDDRDEKVLNTMPIRIARFGVE